MTSSSKAVTRLTDISYPVLYRKPRRIVVQIYGEVLRFREHGRREWFDFPIDEAMKVAVKCKSGFRLWMMPDRSMMKARKAKMNRGKL
jgi:hypothetical protein